MALAFVQAKAADAAAAATSIAVTFDNPVTNGNLVVVCVAAENTTEGNFNVPTDGTNTYTGRATTWGTNDAQGAKIFDCANMAGGISTVTGNFAGSYPFRGIVVMEISGAATSSVFDQGISNAQDDGGTGANDITSTSVNTTQADEILCGFAVNTDGSGTFTAGTNFTERAETSGAGVVMQGETRIVASTGSYAATFTISLLDNTIAMLATYKQAAAGGGGSAPMFRGS